MRKAKNKELTERQKEFYEFVSKFREEQEKVKNKPLSTVLQELLDLSTADPMGSWFRWEFEEHYRVRLEKAIIGLTLLHE